MNRPKIIDKYQIALFIIFGISQIGMFIYNVFEMRYLSAHFEEYEAGTIEVPIELSGPYTAFTFISLAAIVWIAVRFITFSKRKKEYLSQFGN